LTKVGCKTIFEDEDGLKAKLRLCLNESSSNCWVKKGYGGNRADAAHAIGTPVTKD
jgi:hypothetical protein